MYLEIEEAKGRLPEGAIKRVQSEFAPRWENWGRSFLLHGRTPQPDAIRLDGNDYLGLTGHETIVGAQIETLKRGTSQVIQSGIFAHEDHPAPRLEQNLGDWIGKHQVMLTPSGYAANVGLLHCISGPGIPVYLDMQAHMSLWAGAVSAKAPSHGFRHNDPAHLEKQILEFGPGVVMVDSVYSTDGSVCPLLEVLEVVERHGCHLVVDESHSLGTHGPRGAGLCKELGITDRVHFITASLAKAFAGRAGFYTIPRSVRPYASMSCHPTIFSSGLMPHEVAGLQATLDVIKQDDAARERLRAITGRLRAHLVAHGYPVQHGTEQVVSLEAGPETSTARLRDALEERGVFGAVFCAPATSANRSMIRLTLNARLTDEQLDRLERAFSEVAGVVEPWKWPIAKRQRGARNA